MPLSPGGIHNPAAVLPFCPDQTDFLTFKGPHGFCAVYLDLIESIQAGGEVVSGIHLTTGNWYESVETVPELVARFAAVKKLRYSKDRLESEVQGPGLTTRAQTQVDGQGSNKTPDAPPEKLSLPPRPVIWKNNTGGQQ